MTMRAYDVVVLGGGIIGASLAEELARRKQRVGLIERGTIGCEASTAAAGILASQMDLEAPGPFFELCQASRAMYPSWLRRIERWMTAEVHRREPAASRAVRAGFFFPSEAQLDNAVLMQALARACRKAGVAVHEQTAITSLLRRGRAVTGVRTTRGSMHAPIVVDCLGSWGGVGRNGHGRPLVEPARGQILIFQAAPRAVNVFPPAVT